MLDIICTLLLLAVVAILAWVILSYVVGFGNLPWGHPVRKVYDFIDRGLQPVLQPLRRVLPPVRMGGMALDLSPLVLIFGVGASAGPFAAGAVMDWGGSPAFMWLLAAVYALIGVFALYRMTRRKSVPLDEQGDFMLITPRTTPVAAGAVAEEIEAVATDEAEA